MLVKNQVQIVPRNAVDIQTLLAGDLLRYGRPQRQHALGMGNMQQCWRVGSSLYEEGHWKPGRHSCVGSGRGLPCFSEIPRLH